MKKHLSIALIFLMGSLLLSSCVKTDYYEPDPVVPVGYQRTFNDDFNYDEHNWSFSDPLNAAYVDISSGALNYYYSPKTDGTNTVAITTGAYLDRDFLIQTRIRSDNAMGLVFGVSKNDYGYSLFLDNNGSFALYKEGTANTQVKTILDWQTSGALRTGWNDIEIEQVGNYWMGYANGSKLFEVPAQYLAGDQIGYIVLAGTNGQADYLTVQW